MSKVFICMFDSLEVYTDLSILRKINITRRKMLGDGCQPACNRRFDSINVSLLAHTRPRGLYTV